MKLLVDQNLAQRLAHDLADIYPASIHVRDAGMRDADDSSIWEFALQNDFVIVSKDTDFQQRSLLFGHPPKFIWLRVGNSPTEVVRKLLRDHSVEIHTFAKSDQESHLILP